VKVDETTVDMTGNQNQQESCSERICNKSFGVFKILII
jgi:hypothetical protein